VLQPAHLNATKKQPDEKAHDTYRVAPSDLHPPILSRAKGGCPLFPIRARDGGI
jgi:hypothetical protein